MKKLKLSFMILLSIMIVSVFSACGEAEPESSLSMAPEVKAYTEALDMDYAYDIAYELSYNEDLADNKLGWRTAGSDAEHRTADWIEAEMKKIGLQDVEKIGTDVDKFQFNDSKLVIKGTDIELMPAAYHCTGTGKEGIVAEIADLKTGFESDYKEFGDVKGKIVLVKVDQVNDAWIDGYIRCAYEHGAAALVTYATSGYSEGYKDAINVQDVCCDDLLPTVAISANEAKEIKKAMEGGNNEASFMLDSVVEDNKGTTYNVVGYIKGKSSDQQIIIASHYDKYWYGFQDNSCAVGLNLAVAKAMIDSGYKPEYDIVIVSHGAEEWGAIDTQFDWTTGAWGLIDDARPEWADKTLCLLNTELPAYVPEEGISLKSVQEFKPFAKKMIKESGLVEGSGDMIMTGEIGDVTNMEDGVSYRWHGVPYIMNWRTSSEFSYTKYHTALDDKDTWSEDVMRANCNCYGALAIYMDKTPALELDFTSTCDTLLENLGEETAKQAGVDIKAYKEELEKLRSAAEQHNEEIKRINDAYEKAVLEEDTDAVEDLRIEGKELNQVSLKAFKEVQKRFLKTDDCDVYIGHPNVNTNAEILQKTIKALDEEVLWGEEGDGALDYVFSLNAYHDWVYYYFGEKVGYDTVIQYDQEKVNPDDLFWGKDMQIPVVYVGDTSYDLYMADMDGKDIDYEGASEIYTKALEDVLSTVKAYCADEIEGMNSIENILTGK
ncbi:MAG: M28 family peptidase [Lentihominibacter sp.]|jgi:Iap family predicted aminopeptidase